MQQHQPMLNCRKKVKKCWYNEHADEIEGKSPKTFRKCTSMERPSIAGCSCGAHKWTTEEGRRLKSLKCMEHQNLRYINSLRQSQWKDCEIKDTFNPNANEEDNAKTCNPAAMKPPETYPIILSPYSSCWWQQPDPVIPPVCTGFTSRYGFTYSLPHPSTTCGIYRPLKLEVTIHPAKRPTFDRVPKCMSDYWSHRPGRTEYEDNYSWTGHLLLLGAKQYAEPIPSSRRMKDIPRT